MLKSVIGLVILVAMLMCVLSPQESAAGVDIYTPAVELGSNFGYFVCLVFNTSTKERHGTVEFINALDDFLGDTKESWILPPKGVFPLIRQLNDPEVFHSQACHVTSPNARPGDLLITHCGANSGLQCQSTVTAR